jgi:hypothetical protein
MFIAFPLLACPPSFHIGSTPHNAYSIKMLKKQIPFSRMHPNFNVTISLLVREKPNPISRSSVYFPDG